MFSKKDNRKQRQSNWSIEMLEELKKSLIYSALPGEILFLIEEKETEISLDINALEENIGYAGSIVYQGLEDVHLSLTSSGDYFKDSTETYQNYIGYIEILNGISSNLSEHVPMIRGFIKDSLPFNKFVNKMLLESRMFSKCLVLSLIIDLSSISDMSSEKIFDMICGDIIVKLPIKEINIYQKVSFNSKDRERK